MCNFPRSGTGQQKNQMFNTFEQYQYSDKRYLSFFAVIC